MGEERFFDIGHLMKLNFEEWSNVEIDLAAKKIWVGKQLLLRPLEKSDYLKSGCPYEMYRLLIVYASMKSSELFISQDI